MKEENTIKFNIQEKENMGKLIFDENSKEFIFEGNAQESAKVFLTELNQEYKDTQKENKRLRDALEDANKKMDYTSPEISHKIIMLALKEIDK